VQFSCKEQTNGLSIKAIDIDKTTNKVGMNGVTLIGSEYGIMLHVKSMGAFGAGHMEKKILSTIGIDKDELKRQY